MATPLSATPQYLMPQTPPQHCSPQELTFEEMRALRAGIVRLQNTDTHRFTRIVRLIQAAVPDFDGELELDRLDGATLWQMQQIVHEAQAAQLARKARKRSAKPCVRFVVGAASPSSVPGVRPLTVDAVSTVAEAGRADVTGAPLGRRAWADRPPPPLPTRRR